jgi:hypothetical protein
MAKAPLRQVKCPADISRFRTATWIWRSYRSIYAVLSANHSKKTVVNMRLDIELVCWIDPAAKRQGPKITWLSVAAARMLDG